MVKKILGICFVLSMVILLASFVKSKKSEVLFQQKKRHCLPSKQQYSYLF